MISPLPLRRFVRRAIDVEFTVRDADDVHGGEIQFNGADVSEGGAFLRSQLLFEVGDRLDVSFTLPNDRNPIHVRARIAWVAQSETPGESGLGLEFFDLSAEEKQRVHTFISRSRRANTGPPYPHE